MVERWNPFPRTTGEIMVSLEPDGRLGGFVATPRRYSEPVAAGTEYDWSLPFALAGLDMADFEPTEPRYQRYMQPDQRAAWTPRDPSVRYRIEAGVSEGRLSLFILLDRDEAKRLAAEPGEFTRTIPDIFGGFMFAICLAAAFVARSNLRRGRADRRAALRLGLIMGSGLFLADLLNVHDPFSALKGFGFSLVGGIGWGVMSMLIYLALEPFARATWPSLLVSWTRLVGRPGPGARDPSRGRAMLAGLIAGGAASLVTYAGWLLVHLWEGAPGQPDFGEWHILLGQKEAWGGIFRIFSWSLNGALVVVFLLVIARRILRRPVLAAIGALLIQMVPLFIYAAGYSEGMPASEIVGAMFQIAVVYTVLIVVVLNWGPVGAVVMKFVWFLAYDLNTADWGAWHAQPAILATIIVGALALYAWWSATPGRQLEGAAAPDRAGGT
jgi:hypothetical protein